MLKSGTKMESGEGAAEECSSENIGRGGQREQSVIIICNVDTSLLYIAIYVKTEDFWSEV